MWNIIRAIVGSVITVIMITLAFAGLVFRFLFRDLTDLVGLSLPELNPDELDSVDCGFNNIPWAIAPTVGAAWLMTRSFSTPWFWLALAGFTIVSGLICAAVTEFKIASRGW